MDVKTAEVRRVLERYLVEVVEAYELCPWARSARLGEELAVDVLWGAPPIDAWVAAAAALLARPGTRVAMVVAPEWPGSMRALRDAVSTRLPDAGTADFHPDAALDLATPARLVPYLRRSPDPMLQLVPLALLDRVRSRPQAADLVEQVRMLGGILTDPQDDIADRIAEANHARVARDPAELAARLAAIADDRARSYARVGINTCR